MQNVGAPMEAQGLMHLFGKVYAHLPLDPSLIDDICCIKYSGCCILDLSTMIEQVQSAEKNTTEEEHHLSLEQAFSFASKLHEYQESNADRKIIIRLDKHTHLMFKFVALLGCCLILCRGLGYEEALLIIRRICCKKHPFDDYLENCLRAVCCAKCLNWINFLSLRDNDADIQMDAYMHYARYCLSIQNRILTDSHKVKL